MRLIFSKLFFKISILIYFQATTGDTTPTICGENGGQHCKNYQIIHYNHANKTRIELNKSRGFYL